MPRPTTLLAAALLTSAGTACSDSQTSSPDDATVLEEVTPAAGVPNVDPAASITVRFNHAAGSGMEQYVDLHRGDINGPVYVFVLGLTLDNFAVVDAAVFARSELRSCDLTDLGGVERLTGVRIGVPELMQIAAQLASAQGIAVV